MSAIAEAHTTTIETELENSLLQAWPGQFQGKAIQSAEWQSFQQTAFTRFKNLGWPTRKQEDWKYVDLNRILAYDYQPAHKVTATQDVNLNDIPIPENAIVFIFVNGQLVKSSETTNAKVLPLYEALQLYEKDILSLLQRPEILADTNPFLNLNFASINSGLYIDIPKNTNLEQPVYCIFYATPTSEPLANHPLIIINVGYNSQCEVVTGYITQDYPSIHPVVFSNTSFIVNMETGAKINHTRISDISNESGHSFYQNHVFLNQDAQFNQHTFVFSGHLVRQSTNIHMQGQGADVNLAGLAVLGYEATVHDHLKIQHNVGNTTSSQLYKGILSDNAVYDFDGTITIPKHCQQVRAEQLNKNLLLSPDAKVYTRPQLRIDADDVKCAHGATVGQLNPAELFYLQSRGIDLKTAKSLLTQGFANEVICKIPQANLRPWLFNRMNDNLHSGCGLLREKK